MYLTITHVDTPASRQVVCRADPFPHHSFFTGMSDTQIQKSHLSKIFFLKYEKILLSVTCSEDFQGY